MATKSMLQRVREDLQSRKGEWRDIARRSGVPYSTLCKIAQGVIKSPGVDKAESLLKAMGA